MSKEQDAAHSFEGHTPGPWQHDDTEYCQYVFGPDGEMICEMRGWGHLTGTLKMRDEEAMRIQAKNCKLIAVAPDLLAEITRLRSELQQKDEEIVRLKNDLADALDVKNGNGPTALSMLTSELQQKNEVIRELIPIAQWKLRSTTDRLYDFRITKEDDPDKFAEVKRLQSLIEKAKLNYGNREANR